MLGLKQSENSPSTNAMLVTRQKVRDGYISHEVVSTTITILAYTFAPIWGAKVSLWGKMRLGY